MKRSLLLTALTAATLFSLAPPADAGLQVLTLQGTNTVASATTNSYSGQTVWCGKTTDVTFQFSFKCGGANAGTVPFVFDTSVDNAIWQLNAFQITATANGANVVTIVTNLPSALRPPWYRLSTIANTNASTYLTNITVKAFTKDGF